MLRWLLGPKLSNDEWQADDVNRYLQRVGIPFLTLSVTLKEDGKVLAQPNSETLLVFSDDVRAKAKKVALAALNAKLPLANVRKVKGGWNHCFGHRLYDDDDPP